MTVLLLDAYNLLFRSFTTLPDSIKDKDGHPINAVYGLLAQLLRLVREHGAQRAVAAFDVPSVPTFRHQLYPQYQAQRGPLGGEKADDFARQAELARSLLPRLGVPACSQPGYEADDVMGSLALDLAAAGEEALIVSTDRDLFQLVRPGVQVLVPGREQRVRGAAEVLELLGVPPEGVTTFKALAGDSSDNIPGLPGIGRKTAIRLVGSYGPLEQIYEHLSELPPRTAAILEDGRADAFLFRRLVTVVTNLALSVTPAELPPLRLDAESRPRSLLDQLSGSA